MSNYLLKAVNIVTFNSSSLKKFPHSLDIRFARCSSHWISYWKVWPILFKEMDPPQGQIKGGAWAPPELLEGGPCPPLRKLMNHDMKWKHQGKKDTTKIVLNKWPELKYLVQGGLNDYLFFFELFFFLIIFKTAETPLYCLIKNRLWKQ